MKLFNSLLKLGFFHILLFSEDYTNFLTFDLLPISAAAKGAAKLDISYEYIPKVQRSIYLPY